MGRRPVNSLRWSTLGDGLRGHHGISGARPAFGPRALHPRLGLTPSIQSISFISRQKDSFLQGRAGPPDSDCSGKKRALFQSNPIRPPSPPSSRRLAVQAGKEASKTCTPFPIQTDSALPLNLQAMWTPFFSREIVSFPWARLSADRRWSDGQIFPLRSHHPWAKPPYLLLLRERSFLFPDTATFTKSHAIQTAAL